MPLHEMVFRQCGHSQAFLVYNTLSPAVTESLSLDGNLRMFYAKSTKIEWTVPRTNVTVCDLEFSWQMIFTCKEGGLRVAFPSKTEFKNTLVEDYRVKKWAFDGRDDRKTWQVGQGRSHSKRRPATGQSRMISCSVE
jgi:hypothetical protein